MTLNKEIMGLKTLQIIQLHLGPVCAEISEVCFDLRLFGKHNNRLPLTGGQRPQEGQISFSLFRLIQALPQPFQRLLLHETLPVVRHGSATTSRRHVPVAYC